MCCAAGFTFHTADAETKVTIGGFNIAVIVTMNSQASGLTAGTSELMELQICD